MPVEYVNIGVAAQNLGTVSDFNGNFSLNILPELDKDSLLFSCIGYLPTSVCIADLKDSENKTIFMQERVYEVSEIVVRPKAYKHKNLGVKAHSKAFSAGFKDNILGYEYGVYMAVKKSAAIKTININIAECSYDTIFFRLNIYKVKGKMKFENILTNPIYLHFPKDQVQDKITIDLQSKNIVVDGSFLVSLEHVRDLGPGKLYFCAGLSNKTYYRRTSQGSWDIVPVGIGINVDVDIEK